MDHGIPTLRRYEWNVWWQAPPGLRRRTRSAVRPALGMPYVLTEHFSGFRRGDILPWRRPLVDQGLRHARGLAAVSTGLKETLTARDGIVSQNVAIQPNPVRASFFTRPSEGRPSSPPFRFVTVAGLNPRKNIGGLLEAFAQAFGASNGASLTIVEEGPRRVASETRAHRLGVEDRVAFRG